MYKSKTCDFYYKIPKHEVKSVLSCIKTPADVLKKENALKRIRFIPQARALLSIVQECRSMCMLTGMEEAKRRLFSFLISCLAQRISGKYQHSHFQNIAITGPPGVGKTSLLTVFSQMCCKCGIIQKPQAFFATRCDLIGQFLGSSAHKTSETVKAALNGVLVIDEVYSLGSTEKRDFFAKEAIDTLTNLMERHKHELIVVIAGYEKEVQECFFDQNKGLERRFPIRISLKGYNTQEMCDIFQQVCKREWIQIDTGVMNVFKKHVSDFCFYGSDCVALCAEIRTMYYETIWCEHPMKTKLFIPNKQQMHLAIENVLKTRKKKEDDIVHGMYI